MDTYSSAYGLVLLSTNKPLTLKAWNARYETMSFEQDWWFKAGAAVIRWVRGSAGPLLWARFGREELVLAAQV